MHPINSYNVFYVFLCHYRYCYHHCVHAIFTERIQSVHQLKYILIITFDSLYNS